MDPVFQYALNPKPQHECLGLKLVPLTLGHLFLLNEIESPLAQPGSKVSFADILLAVLACSRSHTRARRLFKSRFLWAVVGWWRGLMCIRKKLDDEVKAFMEYLEDSYSTPPLVPPDKDSKKVLGAPLEWLLFEAMLRDYRMTRAEAMDTPVIVAQCLWITRGEVEGRLQVATAGRAMFSPEEMVRELWRRKQSVEVN